MRFRGKSLLSIIFLIFLYTLSSCSFLLPRSSKDEGKNTSSYHTISINTEDKKISSSNEHVHLEGEFYNYNNLYHWHTCLTCDARMSYEKHEFTERVIKEATELEKGTLELECIICGAKIEKDIAKKEHVHLYDQKVASPEYLKEEANCLHAAEYYYSCKCGEKSNELTFFEGDLKDHDYDEGRITLEPIEGRDGERTYTCKICSTEKVEKVEYVHTHNFNIENVDEKYLKSPATCSKKAEYYYSCSCGMKGKLSFEYGDYLKHIEVIDPRVEPTEDKIGYEEGSHCSLCGEIIVPQAVIPCLQKQFVVRKGNSSYGYDDLTRYSNSKNLKELYFRIYDVCESFYISKSDASIKNGDYNIGIIDFSDLDLSQDEAVSIWKIFYYENPVYYWLANSIGISSDDKLYINIDRDYYLYSTRKRINDELVNMDNEVNNLIDDSMNELEKAKILHDYIIGRIDYAFNAFGQPETSIWAHNMVGVIEKGYGVCEAYAKTYLYLCLKNDVNAIVVSGYAGGGHAWNYVEIDGNWYAVDVTWDDLMEQGVSYTYFGMSEKDVSSSRIPDSYLTFGVDYLYKLPTLSETKITIS